MSAELSKWKKSMIAKYGSEEAVKEHLRSIASAGGKKATGKVGFAIQDVEKHLAASRKGGMATKKK